ncbi:MAG: acyl carrier protein, partial [Acidimicrobiales bacterium]
NDSLKLRDYPTLGHVIGFVLEQAGGVAVAPLEATPLEAAAPVGDTSPVEATPVEAAPAETAAPVGDTSPLEATPVEAAPVAAGAVDEDEVRQRVLALVAEKTGYPEDMLALDLDLEADLGVDTVKQAELFATVREAYGIARNDSLKLRDYPTLGHVIGFVLEQAGGVAVAPLEATPLEAAARRPRFIARHPDWISRRASRRATRSSGGCPFPFCGRPSTCADGPG